jgi:hypothetical protein
MGLTIDERRDILAVLVDPPPGLDVLRVLQEHVGRVRDGIA